MGGCLSLPIETERFRLREFCPADIDALHAYACREDVTRYLMWGPNDRQESESQLKTFIDAAAEKPRMVYELGLTLKSDDCVIGALCLYLDKLEDGEKQSAELGFLLHSDLWGQGIMSEAAAVLLSRGFSDLKLDRIWATCDARNLASKSVLEKIGMAHEKTVRGARKTPDGLADQHWYGLDASDLP